MVEDVDFGPTGPERGDGDQAIVRLLMRTADQSSREPACDVGYEMAETVLSLSRLREIIGDDPRMQLTEDKGRALVGLHTRYSGVISERFLAEVVVGGNRRLFDRVMEVCGCRAVRGYPGPVRRYRR